MDAEPAKTGVFGQRSNTLSLMPEPCLHCVDEKTVAPGG